MKVYADKNKRAAIMVDEELGIVKAYGLTGVVCCEPDGLIETEELFETEDHSFEWSEIGYSLELIKKEFNLNVKQISDRFDIPYRTIQKWNTGERSCPLYVLKMIYEILKNEI